MRSFLLFVLLFIVTFSAAAQTTAPSASPTPNVSAGGPNFPSGKKSLVLKGNAYTRPDAHTRFKRYIKGMVGPVALGKNVLSAGYSTWRNSPEEWKPTWEGFGRRFASGLGKNAIKGTTSYALDEAFKLDSAFYRSKKTSVGGRLGDALLSPFTARKPDGRKVFGFPRIAGTYTASIIAAETWYPKRFDYKDGLKSGTISLGMNAAFNVFKEFFWKK